MRLLLTADTHGPRHHLPDWLLAAAGEADLILHAGDVCDRATLGAFAALHLVYAVHGNRDRDLNLPERLSLGLEGVSIGLVHGHLGPGGDTPERAYRSFAPAPDVVVFGHSHRFLLERRGSGWLVNPGSPTKPYDGQASALLLEVSAGTLTWRRLPQDRGE